MKIINVGLVGFAGPIGSGKTLKMHCLKSALTSVTTGQDGGITHVEMADIIRWGIERTDHAHKHWDFGLESPRLSDSDINTFFSDWVQTEMPPYPKTKTLMVAGIPWRETQIPSVELFEHAVVISTRTTPEKVCQAMMRHLVESPQSGHKKKFNVDAVAKSHLSEYLQFSLGLATLNGKVLHLDGSETPSIFLEKVLLFLREHREPAPIGRRKVARAIGRLGTRTHPIHQILRIIESGQLQSEYWQN